MINSIEYFFRDMAARYLVNDLRRYHSTMEAQLEEAYHQKDTDVFDVYLYTDRFPTILRYSIITSAYAIFESALHELCEFVHKEKHVGMIFSQLEKRYSKLERCRIYLKKSTGVDVSRIDHWKFINNVSKVRNAIVHAYWFFNETDYGAIVRRLRNVVPDIEGISLNDDYGVVSLFIERQFCEELISRVDKTINNICEAIYDVICQ